MKHSAPHPATARLTARDASAFAHVGLRHLIGGMIDGYVSWREECAVVDAAYESWNRAGRHDRNLAFSAYLAALDRKEHAAAAYRSLAERVPSVSARRSAYQGPRRPCAEAA